MSPFKQLCIELRKQDFSLGEIVNVTGRPKSSVYTHIRNIPLSAQRQQSIRAAHGQRALQIAANRRGVAARKFRKFGEWTSDYISLVAHLLFDGEIKRAGCFYHNRNLVLLDKVEQCMKAVYDFEPKRYTYAPTGVSRICYFNVALAAYMKERAEELLREISNFPENLKIEFLRSFFDDEGCMDYRPKRNFRKIRGYQKNVSVLKLIQILLGQIGIISAFNKPNEIVISGKENVIAFMEKINFTPGVRINGNRSNSIWKVSLEKRDLLDRAIASYKPVGSNGVHRNQAHFYSHGQATSMTGRRLE